MTENFVANHITDYIRTVYLYQIIPSVERECRKKVEGLQHIQVKNSKLDGYLVLCLEGEPLYLYSIYKDGILQGKRWYHNRGYGEPHGD